MNCRIILNTFSDRGYWINWEKLFYYINNDDLSFFKSQIALNHYLPTWFDSADEEGVYLFQPPSFNLHERKVAFDNGRHLTLLLSKHMNNFPMVLTHMNPEHQWILEEISGGLLDESDIFEMPDLEIKTA